MTFLDAFKVDGKVALVTGGSRGLGLDMAEALILAGAKKVYVSSRKASACEEAVARLNEIAKSQNLKGEAISAPADVSSGEGVQQLYYDIEGRGESKLDILCANAGATWGADFEQHPESAIDKVLDLNVKGVFLCIQAFFPLLAAAGKTGDPSRVIVTGSIAGIGSSISGGTYGYLMSKAAVHHLVKNLAVEFGPSHITVNALAPGFFPTKMSNGILELIGDHVRESNPLGRLGESTDIMAATVYLCSAAGAYLNGVILPLDGGAHLAKM